MKARDAFRAILLDMVQLFQAVSIYPETHQYVKEPLARLHRRLRDETRRLGNITLGFLGDRVVIEQIPFLATTTGIRRLIRKMNERGIEKVVVAEGIEAEEVKRFVMFVAVGWQENPEGEWRSILFGRITGVEDAASLEPEAGDAPPPTQLLDGATQILGEVMRSLVEDPRRASVDEGRDIVASVMKALREEEYLVDRMIGLQAHDDYTVTHSLNVCVMVVAQASRLGFPDAAVHEVGLAAMLHDIGKELVPREILNKPGKLDRDEFARMSLHPSLGAIHLKKLSLDTALPVIVCYEHHVRYDYSGYPKVRYPEELHPVSLMTQIADVYDALRTYRPYRPSLDQETTLKILREGRGTEFHPAYFDNFLTLLSSPGKTGPAPTIAP
jgi:HD-GYP domain-containing protein (c-di-GMP phosphodiesterase class II)